MSDNTNKGELLMRIEALRAQVELLRDNASELVDDYFDYIEQYQIDSDDMNSRDKKIYDMMTTLNSSVRATPAQCLAEIKELRAQVEKLKERNRKLDVDLLRALFYAPSSPVSAQKAQEIEVWYGKFKQVVLAAKEGQQ